MSDMTIERARKQALEVVLAEVAAARIRHVADLAHQSAIYDIKAQEADIFVAAGRPVDTSAFPLLASSAAANERTVSAEADLVRARRDAWIAAAAETERLRILAIKAIGAAETVESADAERDYYVERLRQI